MPAGSVKIRAKLTRQERRVINQARMLRTQAEELDATSGRPAGMLLEAEQRKNRAALVTAVAGNSDGNRGRAIGRPSEYSEETGTELCAWIACGGSLRAWCRETGVGMDTVYRWMRQDAGFHARYSQAHEDRADSLTDDMMEIADSAALVPTIEGVAAAKLRVETRKWIASKLRPQKWGDKQLVEHHGAVSIRIGIPQKPAVDNVIEAQEVTPKPAIPR